MRFSLSPELSAAILFAMEDQERRFMVDAREGSLAARDEDGDEIDADENAGGGRYYALPVWDSSDGFQVMERFTAKCKSAPIRKALRAALERGRGVFRAFKDVLEAYPEMEKAWYAFKEKEMKKALRDWYNGLREEWGLERIGEEPEETEDLVLEDFIFRNYTPADFDAANALYLACRALSPSPEAFSPCLSREALARGPAVVAETGKGIFAGFCAAAFSEDALCDIKALAVKPEYRGLGVGEALLSKLLEKPLCKKAAAAINLPGDLEFFARVLAREGFAPLWTRYRRG
ncbi:MAG: GNAT family N-acetyltransferase [Treponema sp.]|jgi:ribosomal protein S18 acetylase RimI-like enzyme|nr:GNAT family N-acetyltransferase [Treponema sp.]